MNDNANMNDNVNLIPYAEMVLRTGEGRFYLSGPSHGELMGALRLGGTARGADVTVLVRGSGTPLLGRMWIPFDEVARVRLLTSDEVERERKRLVGALTSTHVSG